MAKEEIALLGGGCFWCIEAVYNRVEGVSSAISGYACGARPDTRVLLPGRNCTESTEVYDEVS